MFLHTHPFDRLDLKTTTINGQRWYSTPTGELYPSITTILGAEEKPHLVEWRNMLGESNAKKETNRCASRGEAVHLMAEKFLNNVTVPTKGHDLSNIKLFNQLKYVLNRIDHIRAQEIALYSSELEVAGRCDCVAEFDGVISIIDFKTSNNNKTESMVQDYFIQATAYAAMCNELYNTNIQDIVILIAVEKGIIPQVFKQKTDNYFSPLKNRINNFYDKL